MTETYEERHARLDAEARAWLAASDPSEGMDYREAYELALRADDKAKAAPAVSKTPQQRHPFDWRYDPKYAGRRRGSF